MTLSQAFEALESDLAAHYLHQTGQIASPEWTKAQIAAMSWLDVRGRLLEKIQKSLASQD